MSFISPPPRYYDASKSRALINAAIKGGEIENPCQLHRSAYRWFSHRFGERFVIRENPSSSFYLDTDKLNLLRHAAVTLRVRKGNEEIDKHPGKKITKGITFPEYQFALKRKHLEWQREANHTAGLILPEYEGFGFYPIIRTEAEGEIVKPEGITEFRINHLPQKPFGAQNISIAAEIERLIQDGELGDITKPEDFVARPLVLTKVLRQRTMMYVDPQQIYDFDLLWPSRAPTQKMLDTQNYLALEVALDRMTMFACPSGVSIDEMVRMRRTDFKKAFTALGERLLLEPELKPEECGELLTDREAIRGYVQFNNSLSEFAARITTGDWGMTPAYSKAVTAYGRHPLCREDGGKYHRDYCAILGIAP